MPLVQGSSRDAIGENIAIERRAGKPAAQAAAIAYSVARKNKGKKKAKAAELRRNKPALTGECKSLFTPRFKDWLDGKGHWVTMGSHGSPPHGGVHVELDEEGDIEKGPAGTQGEKPSEVGKKPGEGKPGKTPAEKLKPGAAEAAKPTPAAPPTKPTAPAASGRVNMRKEIDKAGGDANKVIDAVKSRIRSHLAAGGTVTLHTNGKVVKVAKVEGERVVDDKGQPWGLGGIAFDTPQHPGEVEFGGGQGKPAAPQLKPGAAQAGKPAPPPKEPPQASPSARSDVAAVAQKFPRAVPQTQKPQGAETQAKPGPTVRHGPFVPPRKPLPRGPLPREPEPAKKPAEKPAEPSAASREAVAAGLRRFEQSAPTAQHVHAPVAQRVDVPTAKPAHAPVAQRVHAPVAEDVTDAELVDKPGEVAGSPRGGSISGGDMADPKKVSAAITKHARAGGEVTFTFGGQTYDVVGIEGSVIHVGNGEAFHLDNHTIQQQGELNFSPIKAKKPGGGKPRQDQGNLHRTAEKLKGDRGMVVLTDPQGGKHKIRNGDDLREFINAGGKLPKGESQGKPQPSAEVRDFFERGPNESEDEYFDRVGSQTRRRGESEDEMFDRLERRANKLPKVRRAPKQKSLFTPDFTRWLEATRK